MRTAAAAVGLLLVLQAIPTAAAPADPASGFNGAVLDAAVSRGLDAVPAQPADPATAPGLRLDEAVTGAADAAAMNLDAGEAAAQRRRRPVVYTYSHAYDVRNRIHKDASYAMLPLFAAEAIVGQKLYNNPVQTRSLRHWHGALATGIYSLFAVNTVTGVWNLWEGRKDPNGRTLRTIHGLLMLAADVGFVATAGSAPNSRTFNGLLNFENQKVIHLDIAMTSIAVATTGYLIMLFRH
ncbi:MAG: hypothetical protein KGN76_12465 [Acidobacteriota bacterium]|nr:hypothetical protein [Acidobacteriota bacterium]